MARPLLTVIRDTNVSARNWARPLSRARRNDATRQESQLKPQWLDLGYELTRCTVRKYDHLLKGDPAKPQKAQMGPGTPTACPVYDPMPPGNFTCPPGQCPYYSCHCAAVDTHPQWNQSSTGCVQDHLHCIWTCAPAGATGPNGLVACADAAVPMQ